MDIEERQASWTEATMNKPVPLGYAGMWGMWRPVLAGAEGWYSNVGKLTEEVLDQWVFP